jgi:hypothetical protein
MELLRRSLWPLNNNFYLADILSRMQYTVTAQANRQPANNTANDNTTTHSGYPGNLAFSGGVLLPDGRVFCVPHNSTTARIFNPATNELTTPGGSYPGSSAFVGGVLLPDGRVLNGAANLGIRPTFDPPKELLEPHFFDFAEDLYGQNIEIEFHAFIRGEAKFDSLDALMAQMAKDCDEARDILA